MKLPKLAHKEVEEAKTDDIGDENYDGIRVKGF
jgi:hypothetical protein